MGEHLRERNRDHETNHPSQVHADSQRVPWSGPGQIVMGPSFYVWDESPRQAREWGVELANAWLMRKR